MQLFLLSLIRLYKYCLSPFLPTACRFTPTCSEYAAESIATKGAVKGCLLALHRVARCHPWGKSGFDPVEKELHHGS
jgi:putative membrane protein insertion efficiency factor